MGHVYRVTCCAVQGSFSFSLKGLVFTCHESKIRVISFLTFSKTFGRNFKSLQLSAGLCHASVRFPCLPALNSA